MCEAKTIRCILQRNAGEARTPCSSGGDLCSGFPSLEELTVNCRRDDRETMTSEVGTTCPLLHRGGQASRSAGRRFEVRLRRTAGRLRRWWEARLMLTPLELSGSAPSKQLPSPATSWPLGQGLCLSPVLARTLILLVCSHLLTSVIWLHMKSNMNAS